ncbi:MAG: FAD/NAD(P)-binding protein [Thermodesulfobacteriota bacterium]
MPDSAKNDNIYQPRPARIDRVIRESSQIKTFVVRFAEPAVQEAFTYRPGQFLMVSVPGCGEAPISIASSPTRPEEIHLAIRRAGQLTAALHLLGPGAAIGLRGPYGRPFPVEDLAGRPLLFVAGGIGLAPLRSVILYTLDQGKAYGPRTILYGSRLPSDIAFRQDLAAWQEDAATTCLVTVDQAEAGWDGPVGVVTTLFDRISIDPEATVALVCGPPLMIRFVLAELARRGLPAERIYTTLERHMKCGVGVCRHCHLDGRLVCADGPVFSLAELADLTTF